MLVHVDVGTAALGQGLHNASSGKAPILIFAGEAPRSFDGAVLGGRSEHVQWYQDVHGQSKLVEPYSRYSARLEYGQDVKLTVKRALMMATTGCPGPVYLTATREVLAAPAVHRDTSAKRATHAAGGLPGDAVSAVAKALLTAQRPLVVTGYLGRDHRAVDELCRLTDIVSKIEVLDTENREVSFPHAHLARVSPRTGAKEALAEADVILVLDCDVPWIPTKSRPSASSRIFHIDHDPRKDQMQLFDIKAEATYNAECHVALSQLNTTISSSATDRPSVQGQGHRLAVKEKRNAKLAELAQAPEDGTLTVDLVGTTLRDHLPENTIYANDATTNTSILAEQLQPSLAGTHFSKGASGLGSVSYTHLTLPTIYSV